MPWGYRDRKILILIFIGIVIFFAIWQLIMVVEKPSPTIDLAWKTIEENGVIKIGVDAQYPPFAELKGNAYQGFDIELARLLALFLGKEVEFINIPYDGLYDALLVGKVDALISALVPIDELKNDFLYSQPYLEIGQVLAVKEGKGIPSSFYEMKGKSLGVELGSASDMEARRLNKELKGVVNLIPNYESPEEVLQALIQSKVDGAMVDRVSALSFERKVGGIIMSPKPLTDEKLAIAVGIKSIKLLEKVNGFLNTIKSKGEIEEMSKKWF